MLKKSTLLIVIFVSLSMGQPWLQQGAGQDPALQERPFDSSQIIADRITSSQVPVLVDFWAPWCGPCRMLGPVIEDLKKKYAGGILVVKVNIDIHRGLAAYFRIQSIPAVFFISDKSVVDFIPGLQPRDAYEKAIEKILKAPKKTIRPDSAQSVSKPAPAPKPNQARRAE